jgi:hypothetical protein
MAWDSGNYNCLHLHLVKSSRISVVPTEFQAGGTYTISYSLADDSVCQHDLIVGAYFLGIGISRRSSAATEPVETNKNGVKPAGERQEDERRTLESGSDHGTAELAPQ